MVEKANAQHAVCCNAGLTEETSASSIYHLQLRLDRFIMGFCTKFNHQHSNRLQLPADRFSNAGTAASRDRWLLADSLLYSVRHLQQRVGKFKAFKFY